MSLKLLSLFTVTLFIQNVISQTKTVQPSRPSGCNLKQAFCKNNGTCSKQSGQCICSTGFYSPDCSVTTAMMTAKNATTQTNMVTFLNLFNATSATYLDLSNPGSLTPTVLQSAFQALVAAADPISLSLLTPQQVNQIAAKINVFANSPQAIMTLFDNQTALIQQILSNITKTMNQNPNGKSFGPALASAQVGALKSLNKARAMNYSNSLAAGGQQNITSTSGNNTFQKIAIGNMGQKASIQNTGGAKLDIPLNAFNTSTGSDVTFSVLSYETDSDPMLAIDASASGTTDISAYQGSGSSLSDFSVSGLATNLTITLPILGGAGIRCAFLNTTTNTVNYLAGNTTDSTKNVTCSTPHLTTFTTVADNVTVTSGSSNGFILHACQILIALICLLLI